MPSLQLPAHGLLSAGMAPRGVLRPGNRRNLLQSRLAGRRMGERQASMATAGTARYTTCRGLSIMVVTFATRAAVPAFESPRGFELIL